ncbi:hypothetical protein [Natronococcus occultus]|uniref:Divalent heavy-metal cations transporter n=1 Tax=Natronococcus occultus SP4 TaxID=694430 RepID=L0K6A3_9EURY|nr:hypothetical protein [Natronococcus occultus]AGB39889.1 hypothetical protein Natoc_4189 [Natronococcus occultus SP4]
MVSNYDTILIGITTSLLGGVVLGLATTIQFHTGVFFGALVATAFVYDAMFRNPPLPTAQPERAAAAIVWHAFLFVLTLTVYFG